MDIVSWLLFGLIVGIIANVIDPRPHQGGLVGSLMLGVSGALLGGFMANLIFGYTAPQGFNFMSFLVAIVGSFALLMLSRALRNI